MQTSTIRTFGLSKMAKLIIIIILITVNEAKD